MSVISKAHSWVSIWFPNILFRGINFLSNILATPVESQSVSDFENSLIQSSRSPANGPMESINLLTCSIAFPFFPLYRVKVGVSYFSGYGLLSSSARYGGLQMYCIGSFRCLPFSLLSREVRLDRVTNWCTGVFCSPDWGFPTTEPFSCYVRGSGSACGGWTPWPCASLRILTDSTSSNWACCIPCNISRTKVNGWLAFS